MLRDSFAGVGVAVVLGDEVHVMEEQAVPVLLAHGFPEAHIHQLCPIKGVVPSLFTHRHEAHIHQLCPIKGVVSSLFTHRDMGAHAIHKNTSIHQFMHTHTHTCAYQTHSLTARIVDCSF